MKQVVYIPLICFLALLAEFCLFNLFGRWGDPQLLLLVVLFFNLYSGVRFSLWAAFWAGMFKDCFSTMPFGTHILAYVVCVYFSVFIRHTFYERGNDLSKLFMIFAVVTANVLVLGFLHQMVFEEVAWGEVFRGIWLPEVVTTLVVALYSFGRLLFMARALRF